jgi:SSS family solute:Na+ symporter
MAPLDWTIVGLYLAFAIGVGLVFRHRAGRDITEYFLSGRNLPWWILGTSIVATMFAADTPLAVTGLVANDGISGLWFMWNFAAAHLMATFFFARLWSCATRVARPGCCGDSAPCGKGWCSTASSWGGSSSPW